MTTELKKNIFSNAENMNALRDFVVALDSARIEHSSVAGLSTHLRLMINIMIGQPELFDQNCPISTEEIGNYFFKHIKNFNNSPTNTRNENIYPIFEATFRFVCELDFSIYFNQKIEYQAIKDSINFVEENFNNFPESIKMNLVYVRYQMPAHTIKRLIASLPVGDLKNLSTLEERVETLKTKWDQELNDREIRINRLSDNIKTLTSEYNFVGLVDGFKKLKKAKESELLWSFVPLLFIGFLMIGLPAAQISFIVKNFPDLDKYKLTLLYSLPAIITIEILFLYFFRIILTQFRSIKGQLLQLDLRISLCQFIESYAEYASKVREKDKDGATLSKFEALIFSGLVAQESGIPSTFDGIEQVANLVRSFRGDSKP